jgi:GT2 family glycosyltransferase
VRVSVIIVNWNTRNLLRNCLRTLGNQVGIDVEVIVVDNHSSDGSAEMVHQEFPTVRLLAETLNHGYAKGNNIGFQNATGDFLLTLNSDTELDPNVIETAAKQLEMMPQYAALGVKQIGVDGKVQSSIRGFPTFSGIFAELSGVGKLAPKLDSYRLRSFDYSKSQPAPQPMGTFLLFRRSAVEQVSPSVGQAFDEQFPIFFNEVDLLYRMAQNGLPCWYESTIEILHLGGESTKQVKKNMIWESHLSLIRYFRKHVKGLARILLPGVSFTIWIGALIRARGVHAGFRP